MRAQRRRDTAPELALRRELHRLGLRYRLHQRLLPDRRRTADIVFPGPRVVVDVRGCFWHACPKHAQVPASNKSWWREKLERNRSRDADTVDRLLAAGWQPVVVWEHEDPVRAASRIARLVRERVAAHG